MTRLRIAAISLLLAGLLALPLAPAEAHWHGPFFLWPFAAAAAIVGTAAAVATAPLYAVGPAPYYPPQAYGPPPQAYYAPPPAAYYAPPPGYYYPGNYYGR
jgi:hypothetical protein